MDLLFEKLSANLAKAVCSIGAVKAFEIGDGTKTSGDGDGVLADILACDTDELDAIAAVVIGGAAMSGGRGTVRGTLAGVLVLGIVTNILDLWGVNVSLQGCVKGAVIVISVLVQRNSRDSRAG